MKKGLPEGSICKQSLYIFRFGAYPDNSDMKELSEICMGALEKILNMNPYIINIGK